MKTLNQFHKNIAILGAGAFGREVLCHIRDCYAISNTNDMIDIVYIDDNHNGSEVMGCKVYNSTNFDYKNFHLIISIGSSITRSKVVKEMSPNIKYASFIHPSAILSDRNIKIGEGSIISPGCILTTNIIIGKHCHLNLHVTIGHDIEIGDCFSAAPGVNISGNCKIGDNVYIGTGAAIKQGVSIASNTVIGMGAVVVKDIDIKGTYVGNPAKILDK